MEKKIELQREGERWCIISSFSEAQYTLKSIAYSWKKLKPKRDECSDFKQI